MLPMVYGSRVLVTGDFDFCWNGIHERTSAVWCSSPLSCASWLFSSYDMIPLEYG